MRLVIDFISLLANTVLRVPTPDIKPHGGSPQESCIPQLHTFVGTCTCYSEQFPQLFCKLKQTNKQTKCAIIYLAPVSPLGSAF